MAHSASAISRAVAYADWNDSGGAAGNLLFTPTILIDAESATLEQTYEGVNSDQFTDSSGETYAQDTQVFEGQKGWVYNIDAGAEGFGTWGGRKALPTLLGKGQSIQYQVSVYFPSSFDWTVTGAGGRLKFTRISTETDVGANQGYHDLYIDNAASFGAGNDGRLRQVFEGSGSGFEIDGENLQKDTWETIEVRIDLDDVPVDSGGTGRVRVWRNKNGVMVPILNRTDTPTLVNATDLIRSFLMFTYWNGNSPATQFCYGDRIVIETDLSKLVETDANGIGIIGGVS